MNLLSLGPLLATAPATEADESGDGSLGRSSRPGPRDSRERPPWALRFNVGRREIGRSWRQASPRQIRRHLLMVL